MTRIPARFPLFYCFLFLSVFLCLTSSAVADSLSLSIGQYDILDDNESLDLRAEYRWSKPLLWQVKPFAGLEGTTDGSLLGLAGLYGDIALAPHWFVVPSAGMGLYHAGSSEQDLGHDIQFRTQLELAYEFNKKDRISAGFSHTSNCGLDDDNPGAEVLFFAYHRSLSQGKQE